MSMVAIRAEGVGKEYPIAAVEERHNTLRDAIAAAASRAFRGGWSGAPRKQDRFWALRDVSFEVDRGEVLGVIGHNGAGKSTLLKILSRITEPTLGQIELRGRVGSLLEVGTGFHSELSGRENTYLSGAILGMRREEIDRKFDAIVSFAEVERFIDTPVKHYSSGMYLRLAFAVAAYLEPEILLVDEVLAVGDAQFQKKCLGKMGEVANEGRTVILVSHNMAAVRNLCDRTLWLDQGVLAMDGPTSVVVQRYLTEAVSVSSQRHWPERASAPGNDEVQLHRALVRASDGTPDEAITVRTPLDLEFEYWNLRAGARLNISLHIYNHEGTLIFNTASVDEHSWHGTPFPVGLFRSSCRIPGDLLNDGLHRVDLLIVRDEHDLVFRLPDVLVFSVKDERPAGLTWYGKWQGAVRPNLAWQTEQLEATQRPNATRA